MVLFLERRSAAIFATIVLASTASLYMHNMMLFYLLALNVAWFIYPSERAWAERAKGAIAGRCPCGPPVSAMGAQSADSSQRRPASEGFLGHQAYGLEPFPNLDCYLRLLSGLLDRSCGQVLAVIFHGPGCVSLQV